MEYKVSDKYNAIFNAGNEGKDIVIEFNKVSDISYERRVTVYEVSKSNSCRPYDGSASSKGTVIYTSNISALEVGAERSRIDAVYNAGKKQGKSLRVY